MFNKPQSLPKQYNSKIRTIKNADQCLLASVFIVYIIFKG
ncbi:hypothetical protein PARC_a1594 [Pseudoalteromonas arctica A 37-1-2]|uniref:Uncharacterized protein n=1 Tax=Pseudoalteromonas arctica A 37-1-2 TaxID=1117313 RepID=A0A290S259_9GAMM|nr:hypothetical protein PARC_a1594 [Pseudoalteromonas arctica A 37-1-2]